MQDVKVIAYDGKDHRVVSKVIAFSTGGPNAFLDIADKQRLVKPEFILEKTGGGSVLLSIR